MSGINKIEKGVTVGGSSTPWGGNVIGLQYSVSFEGPSSLSVTIANDSGRYDTPALNGESPTSVAFGKSNMSLLPVSYRKSMGAGGRTLTVNFDDMGTKYLDKTLVLLRDQHLTNKISSCAIILGDMYEEDANGVLRRSSGVFKSGVTKVAYEIADLGLAMSKHGIPMSSRLRSYLGQFKNRRNHLNKSFLRTDIGDLRSVMASVATDLGFVPFWNNGADQRGGGSGQGFLDYIQFKDDVNRVNAAMARVVHSCNIEDDAYEVTIKNSSLKGGIGSFDVNPSSIVSRRSKFKRFKFRETITSPHTGNQVAVRGDMGMELLMRAAQMGPEFYKNYVVLKICCAYAKDLAGGWSHYFATLRRRQKGGAWDKFKWVGESIKREGGKAFPLNTVENTAVNALYKKAFVMYPTVYSAQNTGCKNWRTTIPKGPYKEGAYPPLDDWVGADTRYEDVFEDEKFLEELRKTFKLKDVFGGDAAGGNSNVARSEFIGVACVKTPALNEFLTNPADDPVFKEILWLSENYGRWFSLQKGGKGGALILQKSFTLRKYSEEVSWVFSDLAATDTPLSSIYKFTHTDNNGEREDPDYKRGPYKLAKGGQSRCAGKTLTLNGYKCIVGIHTLLSDGANAQPRRTTCSGGIIDKFNVGSVYVVSRGASYKSFALEYMYTRGSKLLKDPSSGFGVGFGGAVGGGGGGHCAGKAGSIPADWYSFMQDYRSNCDVPGIVSPNGLVNRSRDKYKYDTDLDYGVLLHKVGEDPGAFGGDVSIAFSHYDKSDALGAGDLWFGGAQSSYLAIEIIQIGPEKVRTDTFSDATVKSPLKDYENYWMPDGHIDLDYWDYRLFSDVSMGIDLTDEGVLDNKIISYSFSFNDLLQSIRVAYIPYTNFSKVTSLAVEAVNFDIGELLIDPDDNPNAKPSPYPLCKESSDGDLDIRLATRNLVAIMQSYLDNHINPSISREYVISGFGFKNTMSSRPTLPSIWEGLESVSLSIGEQGIKTTVKIGNKRRMKASKEMLAAAVVSGLAGGNRSHRVPNNLTSTLSTKFQTRM